MAKVTITGTGSSSSLYVQINYQKYYSATSLTVNANTTMTVYASSSRKIYVNGKQVTKSNSRYTYTIKGDIDVAFSNASSSTNGKVEITEKSSGGGGSSGGSGGHKTLVNGTVYEITGGKVRVNGTVYEIAKGKTLVNGTAYEIAFGGGLITFTVDTAMDGIKTYTAEEGMTWAEFIDSSYNDGMFRIVDNGRNEVSGRLFNIREGPELVYSYSIITPNGEYREI